MQPKTHPKFLAHTLAHTDTYFSTQFNKGEPNAPDPTIMKAIKQNKAEILAQREREGTVETSELYDENKELHGAIMEMRKKYDVEKNQTAKLDKMIGKLEEERGQLEIRKAKLYDNNTSVRTVHLLIPQNYNQLFEKTQVSSHSLEQAVFQREIRENMLENLKKDILFYKKRCFDDNITLVRGKTWVRDLSQRAYSKKNLNTKSKVVLASLQETITVRHNERQGHLRQVETLVAKKIDNEQVKTFRQHQLQSSMQKAVTERLPEEQQLVKKLFTELMVQKMLRFKMNKLLEQNKLIETVYGTIRKETRIKDAKQFIEDYLTKERRMGELLDNIERSQQKIQRIKEERQQLEKEKEKLQGELTDVENIIELKSTHDSDMRIVKQSENYTALLNKCSQLKILLKRWAVSSIIKIKKFSQNSKNQPQMTHEWVERLEKMPLKEAVQRALTGLAEFQKEEEPSSATPPLASDRSPTPVTPFNFSQEKKTTLRSLTTETVLSKDLSRRNFRVRTMTAHEQAQEEIEKIHDELSEVDYLRFNRRLVKKNNKSTVRARIKTRPF